MLPAEAPKSAAASSATTKAVGSAGFAQSNTGMGGMGGMGGGGAMGMGGMEGMMNGMGLGSAMAAGRGAMGDMAGTAEKGPELKTMVRTDFKIEFVWQPPNPTPKPEDLAKLVGEITQEAQRRGGKVQGCGQRSRSMRRH